MSRRRFALIVVIVLAYFAVARFAASYSYRTACPPQKGEWDDRPTNANLVAAIWPLSLPFVWVANGVPCEVTR